MPKITSPSPYTARRSKPTGCRVKPPTALPATPDNLAAALFSVVRAYKRQHGAVKTARQKGNSNAIRRAETTHRRHVLLCDRALDAVVQRGLAEVTRRRECRIQYIEYFTFDGHGHETQISVQAAARHARGTTEARWGSMNSTMQTCGFGGFEFLYAADWPPAISAETRRTRIDCVPRIKLKMRLCDAEATLKAWIGPGADEAPETWRVLWQPWG